jgi:hypothetical protein
MSSGILMTMDVPGPITGGENFTLTVILDSQVSNYVEIVLSSDNLSIITGPSGDPFPTTASVVSGSDRVDIHLGSAIVTESVTVTLCAGLQGVSMPAEATTSLGIVIIPNSL